MTKAKQKQERLTDGFVNLTAKMGLGAENLLSQGTYAPTLLTRDRIKLENMYRTSWVVGVVVDAIAEDMTRAGISIDSEDKPEDIKKIQSAFVRLGVWSKLQDCIKWGRLYGGAVAYIDIAGQDSAEELRTATIKKGQFVGLRVYDRWHVAPILSSLIPTGPNAGLPELYAVYNIGSESMKRGEPVLKIHHSRLIRQVGIQLPAFQAAQEEYWGESVVERMLDRLISFDTATAGAANLIQKAYLRTVKINKLREILSAGGKPEENLLKMFGHMRLLQTSEGLTLLDKEDEFSAGSYTFTGLPEVILQFGQQISGASGIPLVKFFGQSPVGMNATGESDLRLYYDNINSKQEANLREGIDRLLAVVYRSTLGRDKPESADFDFVPLWQTSQAEKVSIAKSITESITMAFEKGVIGEPTALKELKQASDYSGVFSNITSEEIDAASEKEPPIPEGMDEPVAIELGGDEPEGEQPEKNGAFDRIKRLIGRG